MQSRYEYNEEPIKEEPPQIEGHWIFNGFNVYTFNDITIIKEEYVCPFCKYTYQTPHTLMNKLFDYCPECGIRLKLPI